MPPYRGLIVEEGKAPILSIYGLSFYDLRIAERAVFFRKFFLNIDLKKNKNECAEKREKSE